MLRVVSKDGVKDPVKTEHWVNDHDEVVRPARLKSNDVSQKPVAGVRLEKREVHKDIPERCVKTVYQRECNEESQILASIFNAIYAEECASENACRVLSAVDEVRKDIFCVSITSDTLQETPEHEC